MSIRPAATDAGPAAVELFAPILLVARAGAIVLFLSAVVVASSGPDSIDGVSMGRVLPQALGYGYLAAVAAFSLIVVHRRDIHGTCAMIALGVIISTNATAAIFVHGSRAFLAAGVYLFLGVLLIAIGAVARALVRCP